MVGDPYLSTLRDGTLV